MQIVIEIDDGIAQGIIDGNNDKPRNIVRSFQATIADAIKNGTPIPKGHGRKFEEIVVEYPPKDLCIYPEYRGKPYFSIKYEENGEHFIGFGTYNPKVFSRYLKEYFVLPTIIEADSEEPS